MNTTQTQEGQDLLNQIKSVEADTQKVIELALEATDSQVAIASSFSAEDVVLIDLVSQQLPGVRVLSLDTGRLPESTYEIAETVGQHFNITLEWLFPDSKAVEKLLNTQGSFGFRQSLEERKQCCAVRKVDVLNRGLQGFKGWFTGQRREQSPIRGQLPIAELEKIFAPQFKFNPLAFWTNKDIWQHIKKNNLPTHPLYAQGYTSIGCAPCTRAIQAGEPERAGRWWWEEEKHKECGLHVVASNPK